MCFQGLDEILQPVRLMEGNHRIFDGDSSFFSELAQGSGDGLARGAGHGRHLLVGEEERKTKAPVHMFADLVRQFEEQAAKASSDSFGKGNAAGVLQGETIFLAEALNGPHLGFPVVAKESQEPLAFHRAKLGRCQGFG